MTLEELLGTWTKSFSIGCGTFLLLIPFIWMYNYLTCGVCKSKARMDGKTVIVTGSNSGIGKLTALDLADRGARVIMACRNVEKANAVKDYIIKTTKNSNVVVKKVDLSCLRSVREFAAEVNRSETRLDVLIHNAANLVVSERTEDGLNPIWATNYYGPFLLTLLLINLMKETGNGRIVIVSSALHWLGSVKSPNPGEKVGQWKLYQDTKFAGVLFSNELAERLKGSGVTANALHPGLIYTPLWKDTSSFLMHLVRLLKPFAKNEEQGAQTTIYLAVSEEVEGVTGKYFEDCRVWLPHCKTRDKRLRHKFWQLSEKLVQLKESDPHLS